MSQFDTLAATAAFFHVHPKTLRVWLSKGFIHGYDDGTGTLFFDRGEIEQELTTNPHMLDGRRSRYGANAKILPLPPIKVEAYVEEAAQ